MSRISRSGCLFVIDEPAVGVRLTAMLLKILLCTAGDHFGRSAKMLLERQGMSVRVCTDLAEVVPAIHVERQTCWFAGGASVPLLPGAHSSWWNTNSLKSRFWSGPVPFQPRICPGPAYRSPAGYRGLRKHFSPRWSDGRLEEKLKRRIALTGRKFW